MGPPPAKAFVQLGRVAHQDGVLDLVAVVEGEAPALQSRRAIGDRLVGGVPRELLRELLA
jgi:hypothetical protein